MLKFNKIFLFLLIIINFNFLIFSKTPVRIKDIAVIQGLRENQLMGFGLVTGLQGRGDSKAFKMTQKMMQNLASNHGFNIDINDLNSKNIAAVIVSTTVGPFTREGDSIDITLSSIGDAKSLEGGILLQTSLRASDGNVYAVAQGRIITGNKNQNSLNSGTIPEGGIIERNIISNIIKENKINIILKYPDFVTASQIKEKVLELNPELQVNAVDAGLVEIILKEEEQKNIVDFIAKLEILTVNPDYISTVVINKKTGIIVFGEDIIIQDCSINTSFAQIKIGSENNNKNSFELKSQTIGELVKTLNEIGLNTDEIIALIESIHKIGAINAKLIIL